MLNKINEMINELENKEVDFDKKIKEIDSQKKTLEKDKEVNNVRLSLIRLASLPSYVISDVFVHEVERLASKYLPEEIQKGVQISMNDLDNDDDDDDIDYDDEDEDDNIYDEEFPPVFDEDESDDNVVDDRDNYNDATPTAVLEDSIAKTSTTNRPTSTTKSDLTNGSTAVNSKNEFYEEMISSVDELENYGKKTKTTKVPADIVFDEM